MNGIKNVLDFFVSTSLFPTFVVGCFCRVEICALAFTIATSKITWKRIDDFLLMVLHRIPFECVYWTSISIDVAHIWIGCRFWSSGHVMNTPHTHAAIRAIVLPVFSWIDQWKVNLTILKWVGHKTLVITASKHVQVLLISLEISCDVVISLF